VLYRIENHPQGRLVYCRCSEVYLHALYNLLLTQQWCCVFMALPATSRAMYLRISVLFLCHNPSICFKEIKYARDLCSSFFLYRLHRFFRAARLFLFFLSAVVVFSLSIFLTWLVATIRLWFSHIYKDNVRTYHIISKNVICLLIGNSISVLGDCKVPAAIWCTNSNFFYFLGLISVVFLNNK
jgi:hypothetical protein